MSGHDTESPNLMDELRHVQLLLKREDIFIDFQAHEIQELNLSLRQEAQHVLHLQKFLLFLHMISTGTSAVSLSPEYFDSLFKEAPEKSSQAPGSSPNQITLYNRVISAFLDNIPQAARASVEFARSKPGMIDQMTFSTIPGLFGYLWNAESARQYLRFLQEVIGIAPDIGAQFTRVLFGIPPFRQFFDAVMVDLVHKVATVDSPELAAQFATDFLQRWSENAQFCPDVIKESLSFAPNPVELLAEAFLRPAFASPRTFGIVPLSLRVSDAPPRLLADALIARAPDLCGIIASTENPTSLPSSEKLAKILTDLGKSALFTSGDLEVLCGLVECVSRFAPDFVVKPGQLEASPAPRTEYLTSSFSFPSVQEVPRSSSQSQSLLPEDEIEKQLR
jgi:hypothetical protein